MNPNFSYAECTAKYNGTATQFAKACEIGNVRSEISAVTPLNDATQISDCIARIRRNDFDGYDTLQGTNLADCLHQITVEFFSVIKKNFRKFRICDDLIYRIIGIALIEPETTGFTIQQIYREAYECEKPIPKFAVISRTIQHVYEERDYHWTMCRKDTGYLFGGAELPQNQTSALDAAVAKHLEQVEKQRRNRK